MHWHRGLCTTLVALVGLFAPLTSTTAAKRPVAVPLAVAASVSPTSVTMLRGATVPACPPPPAPPLITVPGAVTDCTFAYLVDRAGRPETRLAFPRTGATTEAIRRMAAREVSAGRHRCAHTMREALGWGLGDAHNWVQLPSMGFTRRPVTEPAAPGDIVVWPFTFGSNRSQHIGFAVGTDEGVRLLSNLTGNICVSDLVPGYCAFYKAPAGLAPAPAAEDLHAGVTAQGPAQHAARQPGTLQVRPGQA